MKADNLLIEVARELNAIEWPAVIPRTPDFIVYALDLECASLRKNLKAILPPERLATFKAAGLL